MKDYKTTLNLPNTPFPMKANLSIQEPEILKKWRDEKLYERIVKRNKKKPKFILHDGPPYANSPIHIGTALNKILKDFVIKYKNMSGYLCEYVPGWDCHGLPIELQALKKAEAHAASPPNLPIEIRKLCREHAEKFITIQREQFKRLGILGEWQSPYLTMDFQYEADIVKELAALSEKGLLFRAKKAIHWCASCQTALAEAEIEYEEKTSPSIYVKFPLSEESSKKLSSSSPELANKKIYVLIWTTTPWTLPANQAVALHPEITYLAVDIGNEILILAEALMDAVQRECGLGQSKVISRFKPKDLTELHYHHPFFSRESPIITADFVTTEDGTGCVHIAPGHGEDDYFLGLKHHLEIYSPVDHRGRFTADLPEWEGRLVFEANPMITEKLNNAGLLLKEGTVRHSYPHCWRCKKPVIFRATEQWFLKMDEGGLRKKALDWIDRVEWIPSWGKKRIQGMMETRPDWCLSRQRIWGVPIPVLYCKKCDYIYNNPGFMRGIAKQFEKKGGDFWFKSAVEDLIPPKLKCPACGGKEFEKEKDILDVWFDSGCSFAAVLEKRGNLSCPADLYLEGSDQHRGWFHTSLLVSAATRNTAPYKSVLTHGFVVDGEGRKMSKSLGNVVEPEKVISQHGAEILRLWVASENYQYDIHCSDDLIKRCSEVYRKIRNTCRHILGNISDFNPKRDAIPYTELFEIDQYALLKLQRFIEKAKKGYEQYEFHSFFHALNNYCVVDLSAFYLDILKDRLYTYAAKSKERRSAQTALHEILLSMTQWMTPVLPFTAEEIYQQIRSREKSVHLTNLPEIKKEYLNSNLEKRWEQLIELRQIVSKALEEARAKKIIGNSLEAKVTLHLPKQWEGIVAETTTDLSQLFIVSQVNKTALDTGELKVEVASADGQKCERCWIWSTSVTENHPVCEKCKGALVYTARHLP